MIRVAVVALLLLVFGDIQAQERYWVFLSDKGNTARLEAKDILSEAALKNRARQGIGLDTRDFPVNDPYVREVESLVNQVRHRSRWFNALSVQATPDQLAQVRTLPFVRDIRPVAKLEKAPRAITIDCDTVAYKGTAYRQLGMIGLDDLHLQGFTGEGVTIAVFDNGYYRIDSLDAFDHLFDEGRILGQWDFVDNEQAVFDKCIHCQHGTYVFSIMAAVHPGQMYGGAPGANYYLFRTEDDYSETTAEEDNWVAAAELADSLGAQIFTTSLGYKDFDNGLGDYSDEDLDGNTALITRAGDIAASRGILVVNSAGNNGNKGINAPADGDSVLAVGAVDECESIAFFSSRGPSADGRIKPDLVAMGQSAYFLYPDGSLRYGNGTSFSCPLMTSLAACLMQKHPELSAWELHQALIQSGDRYNNPDNIYGYGLPHAARVEEQLNTGPLSNVEYEDFASGDLLVYPNPASEFIRVAWLAPVSPASYEVELVDPAGRRIRLETGNFSDSEWQLSLPVDLTGGIYVLRIQSLEYEEVVYLRKVSIQ